MRERAKGHRILRVIGLVTLAALSLVLAISYWQCFAGTVMFR